jgi:hypothetical protein
VFYTRLLLSRSYFTILIAIARITATLTLITFLKTGFSVVAPSYLKFALAWAVGLCSACLLYILINALLLGQGKIKLCSTAVKLSLFAGSFVFSALLLDRYSKFITELIARAFLLGSVEWLAVALAGIFLFNGVPYVGAAMSLNCLIGFGITQWWAARRNKAQGGAALALNPPN